MPTVATRNVNSYRIGGRVFTRAPTEISYEEALELQDVPFLNVTITREDHRDYFARGVGSETSDHPGGGPKSKNERAGMIIDAATQLDMDDESNFTKDGLPDARALSQILGWTVSAKERNEAFGATGGSEEKEPPSNVKIKRKSAEQEDPTTQDAVEV